jgi:DNA-binding NarL/FixJ family response regulator
MYAGSNIVTALEPKSATTRRILLVDDHPIFRHGLAQLIRGETGLEVCGEAATAPQALEALRRNGADAVVLDISLQGPNGIELTKQIRAEHPKMRILIVSVHDERHYALRALRAGASGYLMKREGREHFVEALRKVLSGQVYVSPALGEELIFKVTRGQAGGDGSPLDLLSDRELEVLQLIGSGQTSIQISEMLHVSIKTVESHRLHIKEKLGLKTATDLVRFAVEWVAEELR